MATNFGVFFPRMGPALPARVREGERERGREGEKLAQALENEAKTIR